MNGISVDDAAILNALFKRYGRDAIISALPGRPRARVGRRSDAQQKNAVVWAHLQFLQKHRVQQPKKKLQIACDILSENLNSYLVGRRKQRAGAFRKMHFKAKKAGVKAPSFHFSWSDYLII
jgi:hypothetical protein